MCISFSVAEGLLVFLFADAAFMFLGCRDFYTSLFDTSQIRQHHDYKSSYTSES